MQTKELSAENANTLWYLTLCFSRFCGTYEQTCTEGNWLPAQKKLVNQSYYINLNKLNKIFPVDPKTISMTNWASLLTLVIRHRSWTKKNYIQLIALHQTLCTFEPVTKLKHVPRKNKAVTSKLADFNQKREGK